MEEARWDAGCRKTMSPKGLGDNKRLTEPHLVSLAHHLEQACLRCWLRAARLYPGARGLPAVLVTMPLA